MSQHFKISTGKLGRAGAAFKINNPVKLFVLWLTPKKIVNELHTIASSFHNLCRMKNQRWISFELANHNFDCREYIYSSCNISSAKRVVRSWDNDYLILAFKRREINFLGLEFIEHILPLSATVI
jgi:hypothetical protein